MENYKKNIAPVVTGKTKTQKSSLLKRVVSKLISEEAANTPESVMDNVIWPAIRKMLVDGVSNAANMIFYGAAKTPSSTPASKISYTSFSKPDTAQTQSRVGRREVFDYDNVIFTSAQDAKDVLSGMEEIIDAFRIVSVADFYELAGIHDNDNYQCDKYGWTNIRSAQIVRCRDGFMIQLPKPMPID